MPRQHSCRGVGNNGSMLCGMEPWLVVLLHRRANKATKAGMILIQINLTCAYSSMRYQSVAAIVKLPWTFLSVLFPVTLALLSHGHGNWLNLQISKWTCSIPHNVPFRTEMCIFLFWIEPFGICKRCILGFVKLIYCFQVAGPLSLRYSKFCIRLHPIRYAYVCFILFL